MAYIDVAARFTYIVNAEQITQFENAMRVIYDGSMGLRQAVNGWLNTHPNENISIKFEANRASAPVLLGIGGEGKIFIDPAFATNFTYVTTNGKAVDATLETTLVHELGHAVGGKLDNDSFANLSGDNINQVQPWLRQLGYETRSSYNAIEPNGGLLKIGADYTEGKAIKNSTLDRLGGYDNTAAGGFAFDTGNVNLTAAGVKGSTLVIGGAGINTYTGTTSNHWLYGGAGNDTIRGGSGYDVIYGDDKFDFTQIGDDTLYGDAGNDRIYGGKGTDTIYGGIGIDILVGGAGGDFIYGEVGNDVISGDFGVNDAATVEDGVDYADTIDGGAGNDTINGQEGDDILIDGANNDTIYGGKGDDSLNGGTGLDILWGDEGDDVLGGGDGDDILYAGPGNDSLVGGKGDDVIDLSRGAENATILYIKSDGLDTVQGPTGSNITLSFIDLAANQLNFEFRYTSVADTFKPDETRPQFYDTATYQGDLHIVTASGAIIFGLGVGDPDIDISFVEVVTLPDPAYTPAVFGANAAAPRWGENTLSVDAMTDIRGHRDFADWFESGALSTHSADCAFA